MSDETYWDGRLIIIAHHLAFTRAAESSIVQADKQRRRLYNAYVAAGRPNVGRKMFIEANEWYRRACALLRACEVNDE